MHLEIDSLYKTYPGDVRALVDVSLNIGPGMFGLLGPNGAGKSTLMRSIATLQIPDSGTIRFGVTNVLDQPAEVRKILGYLPQEFGLYPNLSAEVTLNHFTTLKGITDRAERKQVVESLLMKTNLWDSRKKAVGGFSGGMKQRLGIAIALAGNPKLLIVDEPTAGLDPTERHRFQNLLAELGQDIVVILSTHIVEDVQELCNEMAIIDKGQVVLHGDPRSVLDEARGRIWRKRIPRDQMTAYSEAHSIISTRLSGGQPLIHIWTDLDPGDGFEQVEPALEDVYFHRVSAGKSGPLE
ncbi:MAG TPA: multidrug ABC transporter ATP-binding protein [Gemmatimonadetes bacterium]|nr:multidrug ABC transporter ATP-binding protein [Gemmatimonadota bacterium]